MPEKTEQHTEFVRRFPGAATHKIGHIPSVSDMLAAYAWRVGGRPVPIDVDECQDENKRLAFRHDLALVLFPAPFKAETDSEVRALIAKVIVADGLWSDFKLGMPFTEYRFSHEDGEPAEGVYTMGEATDMGRMFKEAGENVGHIRLLELVLELMTTLTMPR